MKSEEVNAIVSNVLSEEEVRLIYDAVEQSSYKYTLSLYSQNVTDFELPKDIIEKITRYCEELSGESNLVLVAHQFARYQVNTDEDQVIMPMLSPHFDEVFTRPTFTFDYQLGGNTTWGITVEDKTFRLNNNEALTFSGTHQIHWRPHKAFVSDEYIDMVFCHFNKKGSEEYLQGHKANMKEKESVFLERYFSYLDNVKDFYSGSQNAMLNKNSRASFYNGRSDFYKELANSDKKILNNN